MKELDYSYYGVYSLPQKSAPCIYDFRKSVCSDVTICLASDSALRGIRTDHNNKIIYISEGLYKQSVNDYMDSIWLNFSIIKEIAKVYLNNHYKDSTNGVQVNQYELEKRSDYLAWAFCSNLFFKNADSIKFVIDYLTDDMNIKSTGLSIARQQRKYILSKALIHNKVFDFTIVSTELDHFNRVIHPVKIDSNSLYMFTIGEARYEVKNFDEVFTNENGVIIKCGTIFSLNSDIWYYRFRISLGNKNGSVINYYVDDKWRVYDESYTPLGFFEIVNQK